MIALSKQKGGAAALSINRKDCFVLKYKEERLEGPESDMGIMDSGKRMTGRKQPARVRLCIGVFIQIWYQPRY